jgi:NTP pyrophosphatase (non-canonical NTP hydrolase)
MARRTFQAAADQTLKAARKKHSKPYSSLHEGYAVLLEEVEEFWQEVKKQSQDRDRLKLMQELLQIAAVAHRIAEDVVEPMFAELPARGDE